MSALDGLADLLAPQRATEREGQGALFDCLDEVEDSLREAQGRGWELRDEDEEEEPRDGGELRDEDAGRPGGPAMSALDGLVDLLVTAPRAGAREPAADLFDCLDEIEDALREAQGRRWEIRDEDAVLCASLPGGVRVEVTPVAPRRCEVRLRLDVARLGPVVGALHRSMIVVGGAPDPALRLRDEP